MIAANLYDSLDRYEEMLDIIETSIKRVGKKVHKCEVMLHNEPFKETELSEKQSWQEDFNKLVTSNSVRRFPTIREVQMARRKKQSEQEALKKVGARVFAAPKHMQCLIPPKSIQKLEETRKSKHFGKTTHMGSPTEGKVLKVFKNYSGGNSIYKNERPLYRKSAKTQALPSSLPPWIGPGHYAEKDKYLDKGRPDSSYKTAFKGPGRDHDTADEYRETRLARRFVTSSSRSERHLVETPHYASSSHCHSPHTASAAHSDMEEVDNPWSRISTASTIGRASPVSGKGSPPKIKLPKHAFDSYVFSGQLLEMLDSSSTYHSIGNNSTSDSLHLSSESVVSLDRSEIIVKKLKHREDTKYHEKDYSRGGLSLQSQILLEEISHPTLNASVDNISSSVSPPSGSAPSKRRVDQSLTSLTSQNISAMAMSSPGGGGGGGSSLDRRKSAAFIAVQKANVEVNERKVSAVHTRLVPLSESIHGALSHWEATNSSIYTPKRPKNTAKSLRKTASEVLEEVNLRGLLLHQNMEVSGDEVRELEMESNHSVDDNTSNSNNRASKRVQVDHSCYNSNSDDNSVE